MKKAISVFLLLLVITIVSAQEKQQGQSPFVAIPAIATKISHANSVSKLKEMYGAFENEFPEEKYIQAPFLLDQVKIAAANRLMYFYDSTALNYIVKVENHLSRRKLLEQYPKVNWKLKLVDSIHNVLYKQQINAGNVQVSKQLIYADFLSFMKNADSVLAYLHSVDIDGVYVKLHPHLYANLYLNVSQTQKQLKF